MNRLREVDAVHRQVVLGEDDWARLVVVGEDDSALPGRVDRGDVAQPLVVFRVDEWAYASSPRTTRPCRPRPGRVAPTFEKNKKRALFMELIIFRAIFKKN